MARSQIFCFFVPLLQFAIAYSILASRFFVPVAFAEDAHLSSFVGEGTPAHSIPRGSCRVGVRVLLGTEREKTASTKRLEAGEYLKDLSDQLEPLPFAHYEAVNAEERIVRVREKSEFQLAAPNQERHTIRIEPQSLFRGGGYFMIEWVGHNGEQMLSSRLRLLNGKSWVFGADNADDSSTIICLRVDCRSK